MHSHSEHPVIRFVQGALIEDGEAFIMSEADVKSLDWTLGGGQGLENRMDTDNDAILRLLSHE